MRKLMLLAAIIVGVGVVGASTQTAQASHRHGCGYGGGYGGGYSNYGYGGYGGGYGYAPQVYYGGGHHHHGGYYNNGYSNYGYGGPSYYGGRNSYYRGNSISIGTPGFGFSYYGW